MKNFSSNLRSNFFIRVFNLSLFFLGLWAASAQAMAPIQRMVLPNQLVFLLSEEPSLPFVTLELLVDAGSRQDPSEKTGLAYLTARGLLWGTQKRTTRFIYEELDFMGASLTSSSGKDYATLTLRVLKKDLKKGIDLFLEVLTQPNFPGQEMKKEADKILAAIQAAEDQPEEVAEKAFQKNLFLSSPYQHPAEGTKESISLITREDLIRFYQGHYRPNFSILAIAGDITLEEMKTELLPRLEKWPAGKASGLPSPSVFAKGIKTVKINRSLTQANVILGHAGISRSNPDYYALMVMNYLLGGGGFSSRLVEEIRNKRGLAYSVASFFGPGKYLGTFQILLQTKNASTRQAISIALEEMKRIQKEMVSEKELEGAKNYLIGNFPMRLETQAKLVHFLTQVEYYGLGLDYAGKYPLLIQSVSRDEIRRVAKKYLHPENYICVVVADLKEAGME
jgi:zinc protease